jgi:REP element-mobilizing transposase RayT
MVPPRHPYVPSRNQRLSAEQCAIVGNVGFFTICAYKQSKPFVVAELNEAVVATVLAERFGLGMGLYVYCLMPDHLHVLIGPKEPGRSMLTFIDQFKGKSTRVSWAHGWPGKLWQPRSYDHLVRRAEDLRAIAEYISDNPVRKGLVESSQDYRWSGLADPLPW